MLTSADNVKQQFQITDAFAEQQGEKEATWGRWCRRS